MLPGRVLFAVSVWRADSRRRAESAYVDERGGARLRGDGALLLAASGLAVDGGGRLIVLVLVLVAVLVRGAVVVGRVDPVVAVHGRVLRRQVDGVGLGAGLAALRERARARAEVALDGRVLLDPVRERVLAVLDDRLAGFVAVVGVARLARRHRRVVDQLQQVLAEPRDDRQLLAVLAQRVELVVEGCLELLARDVGQLCFRHERLGFGAHKFLLQDDNLGRLRFLVLELSDLVGNFLFA